MGDKQTVSATQMSILFYIFMTGSSIINIPGPIILSAKNGAWISLLIACVGGAIVLAAVTHLYDRYPGKCLIETGRTLVGPWLTALLAVMLIGFMFHVSAGIVLDIGLFLNSSMMRQTEIHIMLAMMFACIAITVRCGIETITRMFVLLIGVVVFSVFLILLLSIENYNPSFLLPILPDGLKPVWLGAWSSFGFPFEEIVIFAMLLPYIRQEDHKQARRGLFTALFANAFSLIAATLSTLMTFGPMAGERKYSLFEVARLIDLGEALQRIEVTIGISLIVASYMKATIAVYVLSRTIARLFHIPDERLVASPVALISYLLSLLALRPQEAGWVEFVQFVHPLWGMFALLVPLFVIYAVSLVRGRPRPTS